MWKLVTTFSEYLNGYPTFVLSIMGIGLLTAFIGDLASHLGCTVNLKDTITAIAFVALGTSVPGKVLCPKNPDMKIEAFIVFLPEKIPKQYMYYV